jgi:hypothetical protein
MASKAYIHIGTSKTGTTSIQRSMALHAARLRRDHSINYPDHWGNHMVLALPFLGGQHFLPVENHLLRGRATPQDLAAAADRLIGGLRREASLYRTHVLSSEQLHFLTDESVFRLKSFFDEIGLLTSIIVYVRHPAERISSLIAQRVRSGRFSLRTFEVEDDVLPLLQRYANIFGRSNMIVRRFGQRYWPNGRLIDDFTSTFNGTPLGEMTELRQNESLSAPAVMIADRLFDIAPLPSGKRGDEFWLHQIAGPKFLAPRAIVERAMEASSDCLAYLDREFGIQFHEVDLTQFPETLSTDFPPETLASLASLLNEHSKIVSPANRGPISQKRPRFFRRLYRHLAKALGAGTAAPAQR